MPSFLIRFTFVVFASILPLAPCARSQTLAFTVPPGGSDDNGGLQNFGSSLGLLFTLSGSLTVTSVGYWDDGRDGLTSGAAVTVAIFDRNASGGPAIVSGTQKSFIGNDGVLVGGIITNELTSDPTPVATGRQGQFRLANLPTPVVLPAGNYALVAWGYDGTNEFLNGANTGPVVDVTSFGVLTFDGSAFDNTSSPGAYPMTNDNGFAQYTSATFSPDSVSAIPEPSAVALALSASALIGARFARRARARS